VQLLRFLSRDFAPLNMICDRDQMFERLIYDRSKAVFEYFGLPFDAEPPPAEKFSDEPPSGRLRVIIIGPRAGSWREF